MTSNGTLFTLLALAACASGCANAGAGMRPLAAFRTPAPQADRLATRLVSTPTAELGAPQAAPAGDSVRPSFVAAEPPAPPPPPSPRELVPIRPTPDAVWIPGHHVYTGAGHYEWVPGHWEVPPTQAAQFERPHWVRQASGFVYVPGGWR